jgi:hypothetical protein
MDGSGETYGGGDPGSSQNDQPGPRRSESHRMEFYAPRRPAGTARLQESPKMTGSGTELQNLEMLYTIIPPDWRSDE